MKPGQSKPKGNAFENKIAKELSLWLTHGKRADLLERSSNSGGKATVHRKAGRDFTNIAGDLMAVGAEGHQLINHFIVEIKHQNEINLNVSNLIFQTATDGLVAYWKKLLGECQAHHKIPMLIFRQNSRPIYIILCNEGIKLFNCAATVTAVIRQPKKSMNIIPFQTFLNIANPSVLIVQV